MRVIDMLREPRERVRDAIHVLQGRPLAYKLTFIDGTLHIRENTWVHRCFFSGFETAMRVDLGGWEKDAGA
jgi:hypothetical protein